MIWFKMYDMIWIIKNSKWLIDMIKSASVNGSERFTLATKLATVNGSERFTNLRTIVNYCELIVNCSQNTDVCQCERFRTVHNITFSYHTKSVFLF